MNSENKKYLQCSCGSEVMLFEKDPEINHWYVCIYKLSTIKPGIKNRLRQIWEIIKTGEPHSDQIVLDEESITELKNFLNNHGK